MREANIFPSFYPLNGHDERSGVRLVYFEIRAVGAPKIDRNFGFYREVAVRALS